MAFPGCLFIRVGNTKGQRSDFSTVNGKAERNVVDAQTVELSVWELPWDDFVFFKAHFPQGFALPNLLYSICA